MVENLVITPETIFTSHQQAAEVLLQYLKKQSAGSISETTIKKPDQKIDLSQRGARVPTLGATKLRLALSGSSLKFPENLWVQKVGGHEGQPEKVPQPAGQKNKVRVIFYDLHKSVADVWRQVSEKLGLEVEMVSIRSQVNRQLGVREYQITGPEINLTLPLTDPRISMQIEAESDQLKPISATELSHWCLRFPELAHPEENLIQVVIGSARSLEHPQLFRKTPAITLPATPAEAQNMEVGYDPGAFSFYQVELKQV